MNGTGTPLLFVSTVGPTYDKQCTFDWIRNRNNTAHKSTDCIVPSMLTPETERNARDPTGVYITNFPKQKKTYEPYHIGKGKYGFPPMIDWPNLTSSMCYLSYCAKTYTADMRNGTFHENLIGEHDVLSFNSTDARV